MARLQKGFFCEVTKYEPIHNVTCDTLRLKGRYLPKKNSPTVPANSVCSFATKNWGFTSKRSCKFPPLPGFSRRGPAGRERDSIFQTNQDFAGDEISL